jgi:hypothetical protein
MSHAAATKSPRNLVRVDYAMVAARLRINTWRQTLTLGMLYFVQLNLYNRIRIYRAANPSTFDVGSQLRFFDLVVLKPCA